MPFSIGIVNPKREVNLGTLMRSAAILGASSVFTIGARYRHQCSDTLKAYRWIPVMGFDSVEDYKKSAPYDWVPVGIEISESASKLEAFCHPKRCVYFLGAEDSGLPKEVMSFCKYIVRLPGEFCLNVSVAGSIVMYDRLAKQE